MSYLFVYFLYCPQTYEKICCRGAHKDRGFADIGYHYYITRDGELHRCRPENQIGARFHWKIPVVACCAAMNYKEANLPVILVKAILFHFYSFFS